MSRQDDKLDSLRKSMIHVAVMEGAIFSVCEEHGLTRKEIREYCLRNPDFHEEFESARLAGQCIRALKLNVEAKKLVVHHVDNAITRGVDYVDKAKGEYLTFAKSIWPDIKGMTLFECKEWLESEILDDEREIAEAVEAVHDS
ncbi:hypothetical protein VCHA53O463_110126 [Vibrio chagasii]|uniref:hypothetical protein n=1 Tax=Vibrio crassostreae TaxID=246167 RepID=UPI001B3081EF|nr:hypothetical protein [Vibrio crassostreae]CAH6902469.1 hypothetical protein VCHA35P150_20427 [Vibrio chagasii]CAH6905204.1 hypothetical protein VCHA56P515_100036 [Vibrio chagasii]CAH6970256.1 hypothetical protein VCHA53O463_110126 [Vibrio chagasii]CAH7049000.1 hypothetical protein VCHA36P166_50179 [Vibrio chagasii]CAH7387472.1 hypothetical protein VCHA53O464_20041 [Vibrio chagasii]